MVDIVPAVLPHTLEELGRDLERLRGVVPLVQIDLVGKNILEAEEEMPLRREFDFEFDLMTASPRADARRAVALGASRVVVHLMDAHARDALQFLQAYRGGTRSIEVGAALASRDAPEALEPFAGLYDYVQVMGITHIGRQGEPFDPRAVDAVRSLRKRYPELVIQVDGHAAGHERALVAAGANRLVVGSAITRADNPHEAYEEIYTRANAH